MSPAQWKGARYNHLYSKNNRCHSLISAQSHMCIHKRFVFVTPPLPFSLWLKQVIIFLILNRITVSAWSFFRQIIWQTHFFLVDASSLSNQLIMYCSGTGINRVIITEPLSCERLAQYGRKLNVTLQTHNVPTKSHSSPSPKDFTLSRLTPCSSKS